MFESIYKQAKTVIKKICSLDSHDYNSQILTYGKLELIEMWYTTISFFT